MGLLNRSLERLEQCAEQTMPRTSIVNGQIGRIDRPPNGTQDEISTAAEVIEAGDFLIDVPARKATLRGRELDLTSAEFEVLVFLAGHPKSLVTPHTMLATNWASGQIRQARFLRALISLTKKLDSAAGS